MLYDCYVASLVAGCGCSVFLSDETIKIKNTQ